MNRSTSFGILCFLGTAALAACGSSSSTGTGGSGGTAATTSTTTTSTSSTTTSSTTSTGTTTSTTSSTTTSSSTGTGGSAAACTGATPVALTVLNYDAWCTVTVMGHAASGAGSQTVCVADGTVDVSDTADSGFQLGDWHGTTGDTGNGDPGTVASGVSSTTVTTSGTSKCISVCCPFTGGTGCPTTNQCP